MPARSSFIRRAPTSVRLAAMLLVSTAALLAARPAAASAWLEGALSTVSDSNVFSYVDPYYDDYALLDLRGNLKDKLDRATHYGLNYALRGATYNRYASKTYLSNSFGGSLEEDLTSELVAGLSTQGTWYQYSDPTSAKYNYLNLSANAGLRYYWFALDFTSFELGVRYQVYTLPNYNFASEGFTPSLTFQEEVAEYSGVGATLNVVQALQPTLDLELGGSWIANACPERPLYEASATTYNAVYLPELRRDQIAAANAGLTWRFLKSSFLKAGYAWSQTRSNANTLVYGTPSGRSGTISELEYGYYDLTTNGVTLSSVYCFGQENSFLRLNLGYNLSAYAQRRARDAAGGILAETRTDRQYNLLLEMNQRLGEWAGTSWLVRLSYNYIQNLSNDYYYQYRREVFTLGLAGNLFL